jgi:hypothetical protein
MVNGIYAAGRQSLGLSRVKYLFTGRTEAPVLPLSASAARGVEAAWQVVAGRLPAMTEVASR